MKLIKRYRYANKYNTGLFDLQKRPIFRLVVGGVPNVETDLAGTLLPLEKNLIDTGSPETVWKPMRGPGKISFHGRGNNKYLTQIEAFTGEKLSVTIPAMPATTPVILPDEISIKWTFPNGNTITKYVTEKGIKETVFQKAGEIIKFRYAVEGLDIVEKTNYLEFNSKATGKQVFKTEAPYDVDTGLQIPVTIRKTGVVWDITYPAVGVDRTIDPTIVFGDASGQIGTNKNNRIRSDNVNSANGEGTFIRIDLTPFEVFLIRFDLSSIPTTAIINTAVLSYILHEHTQAGDADIVVARLVTDWGETLTDAGANETPATNGQGTFGNAFDFSDPGVTDVRWGGGGQFALVTDTDGVLDTVTVNAGDPTPTTYEMNVEAGVENQILNDATNYGFAVYTTTDLRKTYGGLDNATPALRPFLTVDYVIPVSLTSITPNKGLVAGGTPVTIVGAGFGAAQGSGTATIDGNSITIDTWGDTQITGSTPAGTAGAKDVVVTNDNSQSDTLAGGYTYFSVGYVPSAKKANKRRLLDG